MTELELIKSFQEGNREAAENLLKMHSGFIWLCIKRTRHPKYITEDDLYSIAVTVFLLCITRYDISRNNVLLTFAGVAIRKGLWAYVRKQQKINKRVVKRNLEEIEVDFDTSEYDYNELIDKINSLPKDRMKSVIFERLENKSFIEIARERNLEHHSSVQRSYERGLSKLREMYGIIEESNG